MKKLFYFMSLFLGLLVSSSAFVACGDDDDEKDAGGGQQGGGTTTTITEKDILGTWYGVEESSDKINVFVMAFYEGGCRYDLDHEGWCTHDDLPGWRKDGGPSW